MDTTNSETQAPVITLSEAALKEVKRLINVQGLTEGGLRLGVKGESVRMENGERVVALGSERQRFGPALGPHGHLQPAGGRGPRDRRERMEWARLLP